MAHIAQFSLCSSGGYIEVEEYTTEFDLLAKDSYVVPYNQTNQTVGLYCIYRTSLPF